MKIVHICLCGPVTDGFNYQDNLLTKYHKKLNHEVKIITSKWIWGENGELTVTELDKYLNVDGVELVRLEIKGKNDFSRRLKRYIGLYNELVKSNPDILFIHGCQFLDIDVIVKYLKTRNNIKVYVDNHADYSNSAQNIFSKLILHGIIWRKMAKRIEPYTTKFYGVLPARVDFLKDVYCLPKEKVELLVMGADDEKVKQAQKNINLKSIRNKYGIKNSDFLIVTGGKIDAAKTQTLTLMKVIKKLDNSKIKLLIFGSVSEELKNEFNNLIDNKNIKYAGWISGGDTYDYFQIADLVIFPGRHSVFWEQVVGQGIPMIVKYWDGTTHIDLGGNIEYLYNDSQLELENKILNCVNDITNYTKMKEVAEKFGMEYFSYQSIAKRSIEESK